MARGKPLALTARFRQIALDDEDLGEAASANRWRSITKLAAVCHEFIREIALKLGVFCRSFAQKLNKREGIAASEPEAVATGQRLSSKNRRVRKTREEHLAGRYRSRF